MESSRSLRVTPNCNSLLAGLQNTSHVLHIAYLLSHLLGNLIGQGNCLEEGKLGRYGHEERCAHSVVCSSPQLPVSSDTTGLLKVSQALQSLWFLSLSFPNGVCDLLAVIGPWHVVGPAVK